MIQSSVRKRTPTGISLVKTVFPALILILSACQNKERNPQQKNSRQQRVVKISLVSSPESFSFAKNLVQDYLSTNPTIGNGDRISLSLVPKEASHRVSEQVASGSLKVEAWLASSRSAVSWANANRKNLAAEQVDCKTIHENGLEWVANYKLKDIKEPSSLEDVILAEPASIALKERRTDLVRPVDDYGAGFSVLRALSRSNVDVKELLSQSFLSRHSLRSNTAASTTLLFRNAGEETALGGFFLEHEVMGLGVSGLKRHKILGAGQSWQLCRSAADWISSKKEAAIRSFLNFAHRKLEVSEASPLAYPALDEKSLTFAQARELWEEAQPGTAVAFVLDASGSMQDEGKLGTQSWLVSEFQRRLSVRDRNALLTFNNNAQLILPVLPERPYGDKEISKKVFAVSAAGGSALYDAIRRAMEQLLLAPPGMQRVLIFITDGADTHSQMTANLLTSYLEKRFRESGILTLGVGIRSVDSNFGELKSIFRTKPDMFVEIRPDRPSQALELVDGFL